MLPPGEPQIHRIIDCDSSLNLRPPIPLYLLVELVIPRLLISYQYSSTYMHSLQSTFTSRIPELQANERPEPIT